MSPAPFVSCFPSCRFSICPPAASFQVGIADVAFTPPICSSSTPVGHVDATGEAYFVDSGTPVPVSQYIPDGLQQSFSPSFFKSLSADGSVYPGDLSGVGHETPQQNQADFLDGKCVVLPLKSYQVLGEDGVVVDNVHPTNDLVDCVAVEINVGPSEAQEGSGAMNSEDDGESREILPMEGLVEGDGEADASGEPELEEGELFSSTEPVVGEEGDLSATDVSIEDEEVFASGEPIEDEEAFASGEVVEEDEAFASDEFIGEV